MRWPKRCGCPWWTLQEKIVMQKDVKTTTVNQKLYSSVLTNNNNNKTNARTFELEQNTAKKRSYSTWNSLKFQLRISVLIWPWTRVNYLISRVSSGTLIRRASVRCAAGTGVRSARCVTRRLTVKIFPTAAASSSSSSITTKLSRWGIRWTLSKSRSKRRRWGWKCPRRRWKHTPCPVVSWRRAAEACWPWTRALAGMAKLWSLHRVLIFSHSVS